MIIFKITMSYKFKWLTIYFHTFKNILLEITVHAISRFLLLYYVKCIYKLKLKIIYIFICSIYFKYTFMYVYFIPSSKERSDVICMYINTNIHTYVQKIHQNCVWKDDAAVIFFENQLCEKLAESVCESFQGMP